jgi:replication factor C subunit 3/5
VDEKTLIPPPDWEAYIAQIAGDIIAEHTPQQILKIRAKFYDLLTHCIPASTVLKVRCIIYDHFSG